MLDVTLYDQKRSHNQTERTSKEAPKPRATPSAALRAGGQFCRRERPTRKARMKAKK